MSTLVKKSGLKKVNMLEGPLIPSFASYALPLILATMLQQFYNAVDVAVLGNLADNTAVASVGATSSIIGLVVNTFTSVGTGVTIVAARTFGAKDDEQISKLIQSAYSFSLALGLFIFTLGQLLTVPLLNLTDCPDNVKAGAELYMRIYLCGIPAVAFYNFMFGIMRSSGDSRRPFRYLAISGAVNVVLNVILVLTTGNPVASVAIATVASMYTSGAMTLIHFMRSKGAEKLDPFNLRMSPHVVGKMVRLGIPSAISHVCFSIPGLQIQSAINAFGDVGISGNTAATTLEGVLFHSLNGSINTTVSSFVGQCLGAKDRERACKVVRTAYMFWPIVGLFVSATVLIFGKQIIGLIIPDSSEAIDFGYVRTCYLFACMPIMAMVNTNTGLFNSIGKTTLTMAINLAGTCGFRIIWMLLVYDPSTNKTPDLLYLAFPISYVLIFVAGAIITVRMYNRIKQGDNFAL